MNPPSNARVKISIVTPCYNEEGNVEKCAVEVRRVMAQELPGFDYEHIFCDNASSDETVSILRVIAAVDPHIKVIVNSRNVGPFRNIANGLKSASGDLVVPMIPADLQDPPSVIPQMVALLSPDTEVVYGIREGRQESVFLRISRALYYSIVKNSGGVAPPAHAGEFMLARRDVIDSIMGVAGEYPYIRGLVAKTNPRYETVRYTWTRREVGKAKNSIPDLVDQALNGFVTTARAPIRLALLLGIVLAGAGILVAIVNVVLFLLHGSHAQPGITTLIVATFLFGGANLFFLGLIGEFVLGIHSHVRPDPPMFERERLNF